MRSRSRPGNVGEKREVWLSGQEANSLVRATELRCLPMLRLAQASSSLPQCALASAAHPHPAGPWKAFALEGRQLGEHKSRFSPTGIVLWLARLPDSGLPFLLRSGFPNLSGPLELRPVSRAEMASGWPFRIRL